jgi:hypothetical protein
MNVLGRLIIPATRANPDVVVATLMAVWMIASVVLVLFGIFRLIMGLATRKGASKIE